MNTRKLLLISFSIAILIPIIALAQEIAPRDFLVPEPGYVWSFPADHANHPPYALEWWYYTGHLLPVGADPADDAAWTHVQLTFFRSSVPSGGAGELYFGHFAMSGGGMDFAYDERMARGTLGEAGSEDTVLHVWISDWSVRYLPGDIHVLEAHSPEVGGIRLKASPTLGPVLNGDDGFSRKGPGGTEASYYYTLPRMAVEGYLYPREATGDNPAAEGSDVTSVGPVEVTGLMWMDHEFGNQRLGEGLVGWDWWGLKLPGGEALMVYQIRRSDGTAIDQSEGTFTAADGSSVTIPVADMTITPTGTWTSPHTGATYPHGWTIAIPGFVHPTSGRKGLSLTVTPVREDQELRTDRSTRVTYYEGAVAVQRDGFTERSFGFVELVGYDRQPADTAPLEGNPLGLSPSAIGQNDDPAR